MKGKLKREIFMISFSGVSGYQPNSTTMLKQRDRKNCDMDSSVFEAAQTNNTKISFGEGVKLWGKGAVNQAKNAISAIVKHPLKTLAVMGGTTAALFALPLIGIPSAVGGAAMAIGFAGLAAAKTITHAVQFSKNKRNGNYDAARDKLQQLGGDCLDLALSVPFVPKGIKEIKKFAKYGKVSVNTTALKGLVNEKGLKAKINVIKDANQEASRVMNYNQAAEAELSKLTGITDAEKAKIKQYITEYNVPKEKIHDVVLDQWAKERGIPTKPECGFRSLERNVGGYADLKTGSITLNDYGENAATFTGNCDTVRYQQVGKAEINSAGQCQINYKDLTTGEVFEEVIDRKLIDDYNALEKMRKKCSPEAKEILTTVHEREHINQYASFYKNGENMSSFLTPEAEKLYQKMSAEMNPFTAEESELFRQMAHYNPKRKTGAAYLANPREIQARSMEHQLLGQKRFQVLDNVFKVAKNMKSNVISTKDYLLSLARAQSATA